VYCSHGALRFISKATTSDDKLAHLLLFEVQEDDLRKQSTEAHSAFQQFCGSKPSCATTAHPDTRVIPADRKRTSVVGEFSRIDTEAAQLRTKML
jgi:hypothetical protein